MSKNDLLIVDDEMQIRQGLKDGIDWSECGIDNVFVAENGNSAFDIYKEVMPKIIITDIKMPGLNGLELAQKIKQIDKNATIILLSGFGEFEYAQNGIRLGVLDYLLKPVNIDSLKLCVKKALEKQMHIKTSLDMDIKNKGWISNILQYIHENYNKNITVEKASNYAKKTPNYVSSIFKKEMGITFNEYLNKYRIEQAKKLIQFEDLLIYEVGIKVGFKDYIYFNKIFKKYEKISPTEFRKTIQRKLKF